MAGVKGALNGIRGAGASGATDSGKPNKSRSSAARTINVLVHGSAVASHARPMRFCTGSLVAAEEHSCALHGRGGQNTLTKTKTNMQVCKIDSSKPDTSRN